MIVRSLLISFRALRRRSACFLRKATIDEATVIWLPSFSVELWDDVDWGRRLQSFDLDRTKDVTKVVNGQRLRKDS